MLDDDGARLLVLLIGGVVGIVTDNATDDIVVVTAPVSAEKLAKSVVYSVTVVCEGACALVWL